MFVFNPSPLLKTAFFSTIMHVGVVAGFVVVSGINTVLPHRPHQTPSANKVATKPVSVMFVSKAPSVKSAEPKIKTVSKRPIEPIKAVPKVSKQALKSTRQNLTSASNVKPQNRVMKTTGDTHGDIQQVVSIEHIPKHNAFMPDPIYPVSARRRHQTGLVVIRFHRELNGQTKDVMIYESSGIKSLDQSAMDAVRQWKIPFEKGVETHQDAVRLKQSNWISVPIRFVL